MLLLMPGQSTIYGMYAQPPIACIAICRGFACWLLQMNCTVPITTFPGSVARLACRASVFPYLSSRERSRSPVSHHCVFLPCVATHLQHHTHR